MYTCLKGCASTETDYCSVCGLKMTPAVAPPPKVRPAAPTAELCPDCGAARVEKAKFCELCRFNFVTRESSTPSISALIGSSSSAPASTPAPGAWEVEVRSVAPEALPVVLGTFPLDVAELLIGRRSDTRDIHPEIPIEGDAAVSHRHAKLLRLADGGFAVTDLGSSNGSKLNDAELKPGVRTPLKHGDELRIGRHTLIKITIK